MEAGGYLADSILVSANAWFDGGLPNAARELLGAQARWVRTDEWEVATPLALSQLAHEPRFPVLLYHPEFPTH